MKRFWVRSGGAALAVAVSSASHAALPTGIGTGITGIQTDMLALVDLVWPAVIAGVAAVVILKLFKRFANKI